MERIRTLQSYSIHLNTIDSPPLFLDSLKMDRSQYHVNMIGYVTDINGYSEIFMMVINGSVMFIIPVIHKFKYDALTHDIN